MLHVNEMSFVRYNANKDNKNKGDCTIRALSLAYDKPYETVSKELRGQTYGTGRTFKSKKNLTDIINKYGYEGSEVWNKSGRITVKDFADENNKGTYLLLTGRGDKDISSPYSSTDQENYSHIVCCIDGDVYDSWDSMNDYVRYFCIVDSEGSNINTGDTRYTTKELEEYTTYILEQAIHDYLLPKNDIDYTINNYEGITDYTFYKNVSWLKACCPEYSCFFVNSPNEYTVIVYYLMQTQAAMDMSNTFRPKLDKKLHSSYITIKLSPKATNDAIDEQIEKDVVSGIKKLVSALKKEQKLYNEVTTVSLEDKYPNFDITKCVAGSKCTYTMIYDLLGKCDKWIQENVLSLEYNMSGAKEYRLKLIPKFEDQNNNTGGMILSERGIVYFVGKNAKQLNRCYSVYCDDLDLFDSANKVYNYERLNDY